MYIIYQNKSCIDTYFRVTLALYLYSCIALAGLPRHYCPNVADFTPPVLVFHRQSCRACMKADRLTKKLICWDTTAKDPVLATNCTSRDIRKSLSILHKNSLNTQGHLFQTRERGLGGNPAMSTITKTYLTGYNALNALLWSLVLTRTLNTFLTTSFDSSAVYPPVGEFTRWVQTIIALDFAHVLFGGHT